MNTTSKYEDTKSTAYCFTLVGIIGIIAIILLDIGVIPLNISDTNKITISIAMGLTFAIFIFIGIKSFLELKSIAIKEKRETNMEEEIFSYVIDGFKEELLNIGILESSTTESYENKITAFSNIAETLDNESVTCSSTTEHMSNDADLYYIRTNRISDIIDEKFLDLKDEFKEQIIEKIYSDIFDYN